MAVTTLRPAAPPLPATTEGFLAHRKLKARRTINDHVEDVHLLLVEREDYLDLITAIYPEQTVEGSIPADDIMAAQMIRRKAKEIGNAELQSQKLGAITRALNIVLRRFGFSRNERRNMVGGITVQASEPETEAA
jgi:hypothetical protein